MEFESNRITYKKTKYDIPNAIKKNKVAFGSGGSHNMIIILNNVVALKVIPNFKKPKLSKIKHDYDEVEVEFYKLFTKTLIIPNVTPHIVGYYDDYTLLDITTLFPNKCPTKSEMLLVHPSKVNKANKYLCELKTDYSYDSLNNKALVIALENCNTTISAEMKKIIESKNKNKYIELNTFIDRVIFQFIYTLACIQQIYPKFIHNDMFLRNILGVNQNIYADNVYIEYIFNKKSYYLPANGFYLKINDFGYSLNPPLITTTILESIKARPNVWFEKYNPKRDIFTFLYDFYNGQNFGSMSATKLLEKKDNRIKDMKKIFKKYLDVKVIDKITKINKWMLDGMWNIGDAKILQDTVMLPKKYFTDGFFDQYSKKDSNWVIIKVYQCE
jgi:hypothetical protein